MKKANKDKLIDLIEADQLQAAYDMLEEAKKQPSAASSTSELEKIVMHAIEDTDPHVQSSAIYLLPRLSPVTQKSAIKKILETGNPLLMESLFYNAHKLNESPDLEKLIKNTLKSDAQENRSLGAIKAASFASIATDPTKASSYLKTVHATDSEQIRKGAIKALHLLSDVLIDTQLPKFFASPNNQTRIAMIEEAPNFSKPIRTKVFEYAFKDADPTVTDASIEIIKHLPADEAKKTLSLALDSTNLLLKLKAGQVITSLVKKDSSYKDLEDKMLADVSISSQIETFGSTADEAKKLLQTQGEDRKILDWLSRQDIGRLPPEIAKPLILRALESKNPGERLQAIRSTFFLPWQIASPIIEQALKDPEKSVRWEATSLLKYLPIAHALPLLAISMQDKDHYVRVQATASLGENYSHVTEPLLGRALADKSEYVRAEAAKHIHKFTKKVDALLRKALADESDIVRTSAAFSLTNLDPTQFKQLMNDAINSTDAKIRSGIADGLTNFTGNRLSKVVSFLLHDPSEVVRRKLFNNITVIRENTEVVNTLVNNGIKDTSAAVRLGALNASNLLDASSSASILTTATRDNEPIVRARALKLLSQN